MIRAAIFDMFETLISHYESPLYFGDQMAEDAGISPASFQTLWHPTGTDRTIGKLSLQAALEMVLREHQRYSQALLDTLVKKRLAAKRACFEHLHPQILPMLSSLKDKGILIGLISNCFSEEVVAIRESVLFPYFDACILSYEQGVQKPDEAIFRRCVDALCAAPGECLYIGDGGSRELEAARAFGMRALQATWYFKDGIFPHSPQKEGFIQLAQPLDVLAHL